FNFRGPRGISRHDFFVGSVYSANDDEGAGQGRLYSELYLFHLAQLQTGTSRLLLRTYPDGNARIFPGQSLAEYARHLAPNFENGGRPAFMIRVVLAATLSSVYGIYSGFELCENAALPGREEYLNSEKYQWKERDWDAPGNIKEWITRLNQIRKQNRALHSYDN